MRVTLTAIAALSPYLLAIAAAMLPCSASSCSRLPSSGGQGTWAGFVSAAIPLNGHFWQVNRWPGAVWACTGPETWDCRNGALPTDTIYRADKSRSIRTDDRRCTVLRYRRFERS
jgi:hypothetical protein